MLLWHNMRWEKSWWVCLLTCVVFGHTHITAADKGQTAVVVLVM